MSTTEPNADVAGQWPPQWVDAEGLLFREYGDAPTIHIDGQRLRCGVTESSKFILWFMPLFGMLFFYFVYPTIRDLKFQTLFLVLAPIALVSVFAIGFGITRYHESLGDYIVVDLAAGTIELPRYGKTFCHDSVVGFQDVSGYRHPSGNLKRSWNRQLNMLVRSDRGLVRYHVIGNPRNSVVRDIVDFSGISTVVTTCPPSYFLSSDANGS